LAQRHIDADLAELARTTLKAVVHAAEKDQDIS